MPATARALAYPPRMAARHLVVVPHTHWDREWYATHEQFRHRLVRLVDRLLGILEGDPAFRHFTLDGQAIVLDDYLEVRPGERERLGKLVRDGRLLVGPWYVLPDEWLVSGEALIRNLRIGLARSAAFGPPMRLGYAPDLFGHVGQLPQIFAGFGFETAIVWRGVPAGVDQTYFDWEAPDGTRLGTVYLRHGYGNAVHLPLEPEALRRRLARDVEQLAPWSRIPTLLLMNGSDHVEPQAGLPAALEAAVAELPETSFEIGTLAGFAERARAEAPAARPLHRGELRSGLRAPLLPGCASARMAQKRADFRNDRALTAYLEPLAAWLGLLGGDPGCDEIEHAWRVALQNHPHDSICGCSIDAVHAEIDVRLARVAQSVDAQLEGIGSALAARVAPPVRGFGRGAGEALLVWNPHGAGAAGVDAELELDLPLAGGRVRAFHLRDATGAASRRRRSSPSRARCSPTSTSTRTARGTSSRGCRRTSPAPRYGACAAAGATGASSSSCGSPPRPASARPEEVKAALRALLASGRVRSRARARGAGAARPAALPDELPGHGLRVYRVAAGRAGGAGGVRCEARADGGGLLENETWRVEVAPDGRVDWLHRPSGRRAADALRIASEGDRGDEYNFEPVAGGPVVDRPERVRVRALAGEAEGALRIAARYRVPRALDASRRSRSRRTVPLDVRALPAAARRSRHARASRSTSRTPRAITACGCSAAAPLAARRLRVESAFEVAERPIAPGARRLRLAGTRPSGRSAPPRNGALHPRRRRASRSPSRTGAAARSRRSPKATRAACSRSTLLRAVGWLSRGDLALRPGDAGPALPTPGAQVPGPHHLELALRFHPRGRARLDRRGAALRDSAAGAAGARRDAGGSAPRRRSPAARDRRSGRAALGARAPRGRRRAGATLECVGRGAPRPRPPGRRAGPAPGRRPARRAGRRRRRPRRKDGARHPLAAPLADRHAPLPRRGLSAPRSPRPKQLSSTRASIRRTLRGVRVVPGSSPPAPSPRRARETLMKPLIEAIVKALVDKPDEVQIKEVIGEHAHVLELRVAKEDLGKVIGKGGAHASAIRTIMAAASGKEKKRYILEIIEY